VEVAVTILVIINRDLQIMLLGGFFSIFQKKWMFCRVPCFT